MFQNTFKSLSKVLQKVLQKSKKYLKDYFKGPSKVFPKSLKSHSKVCFLKILQKSFKGSSKGLSKVLLRSLKSIFWISIGVDLNFFFLHFRFNFIT
jgi:hypothetical protein